MRELGTSMLPQLYIYIYMFSNNNYYVYIYTLFIVRRLELPVQDRREDLGHVVAVQEREAHEVEPPEDAGRDEHIYIYIYIYIYTRIHIYIYTHTHI